MSSSGTSSFQTSPLQSQANSSGAVGSGVGQVPPLSAQSNQPAPPPGLSVSQGHQRLSTNAAGVYGT